MAGDPRQRLGRQGEALACRELRRRGYEILARRFRTRAGEIDIVARDGETLVFVEVKARRGSGFGGPFEALTWWKRRRLAAMARQYLATCGGAVERACRFDVVGVLVEKAGHAHVEVVQGAFWLDE